MISGRTDSLCYENTLFTYDILGEIIEVCRRYLDIWLVPRVELKDCLPFLAEVLPYSVHIVDGQRHPVAHDSLH
jgi:hypothetical protein